MNRAARSILTALGALLVWEIAGDLDLVAQGALPSPSEIAIRFIADASDYPGHVLATFQASVIGFLLGTAIAILAGLVFALSPLAERLSRGVNIAVFALPPIAIVPILILMTSGMTPRITLAALGCYFPVMTATVLGLSHVDARAVDVIRAYGGGDAAVLRFVRWRSALPTLLGGLRVAAPNAVLGAILAEFGGGGRFGLGVYLIGSLGKADPARLWGIGLAATAMAGLAYAVFASIAARATREARAVTLAPGGGLDARASGPTGWLVLVASAAIPILLWSGLIWAFDLPAMIAKSPLAVIDYLFFAPNAPVAQAKLLGALAQTLPVTLLGLAAGLAFAFALAILGEVWPAIGRALLPVSLVTQTMPLVALTPLIVLMLGRGLAMTIAVTISVTFFPAFVTIAQGLALVPRAAIDLARAYGAPWWVEMRLIAVPAALPALFTAAKLAAPRALLGVMISEWLASGRGVGNLLNQSRGTLDYGMIWSVAVISVIISIALYQVVSAVEIWSGRRSTS